MGTLTYDEFAVDFDDRVLAHLQVVIVKRFREHRSVLLSWLDSQQTGNGRSSMWMTPHSPAHFRFAGSRSPALDRDWVELLTRNADSGAGLVVVDEQGEPVRSAGFRSTRR